MPNAARLWLLRLLLAALAVAAGACTYRWPVQLADSTGPLRGDETIYGEIEGRACGAIVMGIAFEADSSLARAIDDALQKSQVSADGLTDVVVDNELFTFLGIYVRRCTLVRGRPYVLAAARDREQDSDVAQIKRPTGDKRLGRGVERQDRFRQQRWLEWRDAFVNTGKGGRDGLLVTASALIADRGQTLSSADAVVELQFQRWPVPAKLSACSEMIFLADGVTVEPSSVEFSGGRLSGQLDFATVAVLANAAKVEGRLCADEFAFDAQHQQRFRNYVTAVGSRVGSAPRTPAPVEDAVAPTAGSGE